MTRVLVLLAAGVSVSVAGAGCTVDGPAVREESGIMVARPKRTEEVLINPGTGWQVLVGRGPADEMTRLPLVSTFYYRTSWTEFEPEKGSYADSPAIRTIDAWLAEAAAHNRYVAIRVVPWNSRNPGYQRQTAQRVEGCDSAVPAYIFAEGAQGFAEPGGSGGWVPVFWDPIYLKYHRKLAAFLGKRYAGHPNLAYVDVPAGNYGEMNLTNTLVPELDDLSVWRRHGLTADSWESMLRQLSEMYREAFPDDLLVAARDYTLYAGGQKALPYAVSRGVGFRDDGLGMEYCRPGRENPEYEQNWDKVLCLYENGFGSWLDFGSRNEVRAVLDWAVDQTHASIVMVGKGERGEQCYARHRGLVEEYGQRLGYRLIVEEARWKATVAPGAELAVSLSWRNLGNAPPYVDFALELSLLDAAGRPVCSTVVGPGALQTRAWQPGKEPRTEAAVKLPEALTPGRYCVAVSLFEPRAGKDKTPRVRRRIRLGIEGADRELRYPLGGMTVE